MVEQLHRDFPIRLRWDRLILFAHLRIKIEFRGEYSKRIQIRVLTEIPTRSDKKFKNYFN